MRWLSACCFVVLLFSGAWFGYAWYTAGEKPPFIPLPSSAYADTSYDESPVSPGAVASYTAPGANPRYISIPALHITNARVMTVALDKNRLLSMPRNIADAGWYKESAHPGQGYGAVLIDGHSRGASKDGIFANLGSLKDDDVIIIERGDGKKVRYTVVENKTEPVAEANTSGMKRLMTPYDSSKEGLGLMTNAGNWIPRDKVYDKRTLVRAVSTED